MTLHVVRCDEVTPQPWKNGGGLTRELLAWPFGEPWALRISVADIHADGPFSRFDGIDRWFAVLHGAGVALALPGGSQGLRAGSAPLRFAGEAAPHCTLLDGPTRDLNLMLQRNAGQGGMQSAKPGEDFAIEANFRALFTADALSLHTAASGPTPVPAMSLAWATGSPGPWRFTATSPVHAFWIHFQPEST